MELQGEAPPRLRPPSTVLIRRAAFFNIALSCIEAYKMEAIGLLYGLKGRRVYEVASAYPVQFAKHSLYYSELPRKRVKRVERFAGEIGYQEKLGDYHSHAEIGSSKAIPVPSGLDLGDMNTPSDLYLIVAVNESGGETQPWRRDSSGILSGTLGEFTLKIAAYVYWYDDLVYRPRLSASYLTGHMPSSSYSPPILLEPSQLPGEKGVVTPLGEEEEPEL